MKANRKPWGHEYLIYKNEDIAIWHLFINKWESTSLHCHPNKKTGLLVLRGGAKISFLNGFQKFFSGEKVKNIINDKELGGLISDQAYNYVSKLDKEKIRLSWIKSIEST